MAILAKLRRNLRDLIRHDQERRRALENAIREGLESGRSPRKGREMMTAAKARLGRRG